MTPITSAAEAVGNVAELGREAIAKLPDANLSKRLAAQYDLALLEAQRATASAQMSILEKQAEHPSMFIAGGRPATLWICNFALLLVTLATTAAWALDAIVAYEAGRSIPVPDYEFLWLILPPLLGIGGFRSFEKWAGVARASVKPKQIISTATKKKWAEERADIDSRIRKARNTVLEIEQQQRAYIEGGY